jgi:hypothetical protein
MGRPRPRLRIVEMFGPALIGTANKEPLAVFSLAASVSRFRHL